jgi:hypothetical protein
MTDDQQQPDASQGGGGLVSDATADTAADGFINNLVDDVASHIPGGSALDGAFKTGVDQEANNLINAEIGKFEGH